MKTDVLLLHSTCFSMLFTPNNSLFFPLLFFSTIALGRDHKLIADGNLYFTILTVTIFEIKINETFCEIILSCVKSNEDYTNICLFVIYTAPSGMTTKSIRQYFPPWEVVIFQVQEVLNYRR